MPALETSLLPCITKGTNCPYFVETGTFRGETILAMEPHFDKLFTIEIKQEFYDNVRQKYGGNKIHFILGDSADEMNLLVKSLDKKTVFFLDGHWFWSEKGIGRGKKDNPLLEELESIYRGYKLEGVIVVDDARLFGKGPNEKHQWQDITESSILEKLGNRVSEFYYLPSDITERDRMIIHLKAIV